MSVLDSKALHEQLSVIMATLSKAALAEICAAVDEGYALLQAEIQRSHHENRDLRAKLQLIESIVIRGSVSDKAPVSAEGGAHPAEGWRPPWRPDGGAAAEQELPEVVLIKDEDDDGSGAQGEGDPQSQCSDPGAAAAAGGASRSRAHRAASWGGEGASSLISPDSPRSEPGRGAEETEAGEPPCPYASQADAALHLRQQERPAPLPPYFGDGLTESCSDMDLGLAPGLDPALAWNKAPPKNPTPFSHFHPSEDAAADAFGLKMLDVSGAVPADSAFEYGAVVNFNLNREQQTGRVAAAAAAGAAPAKRSRRFVCSVCNKTYASSQNLEVHMRIHTGQKPFSCDHCGKKFTQSAHLKSHLTIHSGERPHACALCGRSFIAKYSLELHMARQHPPTSSNDTASGPPTT